MPVDNVEPRAAAPASDSEEHPPAPVAPGRKVLYITFDGLSDPLGRSQVLPYLAGLARLGHRITILSCEKPARLAQGASAVRRICEGAGMDWHHIKFRNRPPVVAHAYTVTRLIRKAERLHRRNDFDLTHCRSYVPAMAGRHLKLKYGVPTLFDMRGFWADEKLEGGSWPQSNLVYRGVYHYLKRVEKKLLKGADHIVSLTAEGKRVMLGWPLLEGADDRITVIPCCVDFSHFPLIDRKERSAARKSLGIGLDAKVLSYLGSLGAWYMRDEMLDFFRVYLDRYPEAVFLFVTPDSQSVIREAAAARGVPPERIVAREASREQVPILMAAADVGLFFIRPVSSKAASSPTKMGEMLALGLPMIANSRVGDVAEILAATGAGVALDQFDAAAYGQAIDSIEGVAVAPEEIRRRALPWFDLELGIQSYDRIYRSLNSSDGEAQALD